MQGFGDNLGTGDTAQPCRGTLTPLSLPREALRWALFSMQATGHVLLGTSCYMQQLLDATEEEQKEEEKSSLPLQNLLPCSLPALPYKKMSQ